MDKVFMKVFVELFTVYFQIIRIIKLKWIERCRGSRSWGSRSWGSRTFPKRRSQHAQQNWVYMISAASAARYCSNIKCIKNLQTVYIFFTEIARRRNLQNWARKDFLPKKVQFLYRFCRQFGRALFDMVVWFKTAANVW